MSDVAAYKLVIEDDEGRRSVVPVELGEITIGRNDNNTIRLKDRNISRRHAAIRSVQGNLVAEDLGSTNGLFINGVRIVGLQPLQRGDLIRIGDFQLELLAEAGQLSTPRTLEIPAKESLPDIQVALDDLEDTVVDEKLFERSEATAIIRPFIRQTDVKLVNDVLPDPKPKLIVLNTSLAGKIFDISKNDVVLGRTEDNDIALNHRSISRHHCRILTQLGRSKMLDLGSANGTFINGEPYAELELKKGDLLQLGHVQLRFMPAGEAFTLSAEDTKVIAATKAKKHQRFIFIAGLFVVCIAVAVWWSKKSEVVPPPAPIQTQTTADILAQAERALSERRFQDALNLANVILQKETDNKTAKDLHMRCTFELKSQQLYVQAVEFNGNHDFQNAYTTLLQIPETSVYFNESLSLRNGIKTALFNELLEKAQKAITDESWVEAERLAKAMAEMDSTRPEVQTLREWIQDGKAHKPITLRKLKPVEAKPKEDVNALFNEGLKALNADHMDEAIKIFQRCIQIDKQFPRCYRALGIAYARMNDGAKAARFYQLYLKVDPNASDADQVRQILRDYETP